MSTSDRANRTAREHVTNTAAVRSLPTQFCTSTTARPTYRRTKFCTTEGWFAYRDITRAMRRALLSAEDGVGSVAGWVTMGTARKLEAMGLVEIHGVFVRLTEHGTTLWLELGDG